MTEKIGIIRSFDFSIEHDRLTFMFSLKYEDGSVQGAGGYALDYMEGEKRCFLAATGKLIRYLLTSFKLNKLSELKGKTCFATMSVNDTVLGVRGFGGKGILFKDLQDD